MVTMFTPETFRPYFFGNFTCIMIDTTCRDGEFWKEERGHDFWREVALGAFYVICRSFLPFSAYFRSNPITLVAVHTSVTQG